MSVLDLSSVEEVYLACGYTDMRKSIDGLAAIYSLIETSKANGLDPEKYLRYVLSEMPGKNFRDDPEMLEGWMPWSKGAQDNCKA